MFKDSLFTFSHNDISVSSLLILLSIVLISGPLQNKLVSSANKIGIVYLHIEHRSLIYIKKSKGPKIEPLWNTTTDTLHCRDNSIICYILSTV